MKPLSKLAPFPAWLRLSQHLARLGGAGLLCALLLGAAGSARASLVYQLDITGPSVQATGSITTDGSLGTLDLSDITAWSIDVSSPLTGSLSSAAGNHMACFGAGCGLVATADGQLKFDFAPGTHLELCFDTTGVCDASAGLAFYLVADNTNSLVSVQLGDDAGGGDIYSGTSLLIGHTEQIASVPEPGSLALVLCGLPLGGLLWNRRRNAAPRRAGRRPSS